MGDTYTSLFWFGIITILYYSWLKPSPNVGMFESKDDEEYLKYKTTSNYYLLGYAVFVILIQFLINAYQLVSTCGGDIGNNFGSAALMTIIPWTIIFGSVIVVLMMFPGFKSAFSNVIGYFAVSRQANIVLTELLENTDIQEKIDQIPDSKTSTVEKDELKKAAETILKICGDTSIMINQIVPDNFEEFWLLMSPLMKKDLDDDKKSELKNSLLSIVITRDNVGEGLWFMYTGILLITIINYNMTVRGCKLTPEMQAKRSEEFHKKEEEAAAERELQDQTVYLG
jgi:hypothetical protein